MGEKSVLRNRTTTSNQGDIGKSGGAVGGGDGGFGEGGSGWGGGWGVIGGGIKKKKGR